MSIDPNMDNAAGNFGNIDKRYPATVAVLSSSSVVVVVELLMMFVVAEKRLALVNI